MPIKFPPIESASSEGLLAIGGTLDPETLRSAYYSGIFPWPISLDAPVTWFSPDPRGILRCEDLHISRSLTKFLKKTDYKIEFNKRFDEVIRTCAEVKRRHETSTWISNEIIDGYIKLFKAGHAYSIEVLENEELVGGLYGVCFGELVSGESMFHLKTNASKMALVELVRRLRKNNIKWFDIQMVSPLLGDMGGVSIPRSEFAHRLSQLNFQAPSRTQLFDD